MAVDRSQLLSLLRSHGEVLKRRGAAVHEMNIGSPATQSKVAQVERSLGLTLPDSTRKFLLDVAESFDWQWSTNERLPERFRATSEGHLHWSIHSLLETQREYLNWVEEAFPDRDDPYDAVWHNKLAFHSVRNGDQLAVDLDAGRPGAVVYLSHDDGFGHGYAIADSLGDLLDRWVPLACPGPESWRWQPFVDERDHRIDPRCPNGQAWIEFIGLRSDGST